MFADLEARLARQPTIAAPTIVLAGGREGVEPPAAVDNHRDRFTGPYGRRILPAVGHCVAAEAPQEVAAAIETLLRMPD
jgi:pimeloyl-ACP methyl ester carboxylesterase